MKPFLCLMLLALLVVNSAPPPAEAAGQAGIIQPPGGRQMRSSQASPDAAQSLTYLPSVFSDFRPTCPGVPESLLALFGASLIAYFPLWEIRGDMVADLSPYNHPGVYAGTPLLNRVPALCGGAPSFDGLDDVASVISTGLASAFNGNEGTAIIQLKVEPEQWTDGTDAYYLALRANLYNKVLLHKSAPHQLEFSYTAGGKTNTTTFNDISTAHWVTYSLTWSQSNDRTLGYVAGEAVYPAQIDLRPWSGALATAELGGYWESGEYYGQGSISSIILLDREATPGEIRQYSAAFGATRVLTVIGDSISRVHMSTPWPLQTVFEYGGGNKITLKSHAGSGDTIMEHMDGQVAEAAFDDADIIILQLGVVDDNNGNMDALQAEVEENIAELRLSNPRATLYYMNVLPTWTDASGSSEVDKSNIRLAISAACASQGITCWDTYSTPWITPADTYDGVHPNAYGQARIAEQVLQRVQP